MSSLADPAKPRLCFFFFNDTATTEIYTLSLHDALPICRQAPGPAATWPHHLPCWRLRGPGPAKTPDRKSTRLNSSHANISYAVFCLKKKKYKLWEYNATKSLNNCFKKTCSSSVRIVILA